MKKLLTIFGALIFSLVSHAQTAVLPIYACTLPGSQAITSGTKSSNYQLGVIPLCTVTVYLTGTQTIATTTPQSPLTANSNGSITPIYAATGQGYDVKFSGGMNNPNCTTAPNCYTIPYTLTDVFAGSGGGGVGCTPSGAGPLFLFDNESGGCNEGYILYAAGEGGLNILDFAASPSGEGTPPDIRYTFQAPGGTADLSMNFTDNAFDAGSVTMNLGAGQLTVNGDQGIVLESNPYNDGVDLMAPTGMVNRYSILLPPIQPTSGNTFLSCTAASTSICSWAAAGGGSTGFNALTSGTNTTAAMLVGSGASFGPTGTGTISANQVNGATIPASQTCLGSNSSSQLIAGTCSGGGGGGGAPLSQIGSLPNSFGTVTFPIPIGNIVAGSGTIANLYVVATAGTFPLSVVTFTVNLNGSPTSITCQIGTSGPNNCSDLTHSFSISAGDTLSIVATTGGSGWSGGSSVNFGLLFSGGGGTTTNPLTMAASGGAGPGATFNGSAAVTEDYHTIGAGGIAAANTWSAFNIFNLGMDSVGPTELVNSVMYPCLNTSYDGINIDAYYNAGFTSVYTYGTCDITFTTFTLTAAGNASGGSTIYTGTITGGGSNAFANQWALFAGFDNSANNGYYLVTASTTATLTVANAGGVADTHAATAEVNGSIILPSYSTLDTTNATVVGGVLPAGGGIPANGVGQIMNIAAANPNPTALTCLLAPASNVATCSTSSFSSTPITGNVGDAWSCTDALSSVTNLYTTISNVVSSTQIYMADYTGSGITGGSFSCFDTKRTVGFTVRTGNVNNTAVSSPNGSRNLFFDHIDHANISTPNGLLTNTTGNWHGICVDCNNTSVDAEVISLGGGNDSFHFIGPGQHDSCKIINDSGDDACAFDSGENYSGSLLYASGGVMNDITCDVSGAGGSRGCWFGAGAINNSGATCVTPEVSDGTARIHGAPKFSGIVSGQSGYGGFVAPVQVSNFQVNGCTTPVTPSPVGAVAVATAGSGQTNGTYLAYANGGIVSTSGTAVTWVSGTNFSGFLNGEAIAINNTLYTISTVNSSTSITLAATAGTQTSVAFGNANTALMQYVISGGALTSSVLLNGGGGFMTTPTFTVTAGGTPGTVTATVNNYSVDRVHVINPTGPTPFGFYASINAGANNIPGYFGNFTVDYPDDVTAQPNNTLPYPPAALSLYSYNSEAMSINSITVNAQNYNAKGGAYPLISSNGTSGAITVGNLTSNDPKPADYNLAGTTVTNNWSIYAAAPSSGGPNCMQISTAGKVTNTGSACGSGGSGDTITSPNSTLVVGGTSANTTLDLAGAAGKIMAGSTPTLTYTPQLGVDNSQAGTWQLANGSANAHTILGSAATTSNTFLFPATAPTNLHCFYAAVSGSTTTLTDCGYAYNAIPGADISGAVGSATNLAGGVANDVPYQTGAGATSFVAPVNSAVMVTSSGGVPSESTTLPNGLTIPGYANCAAGTANGDCITNSMTTLGDMLYGGASGASTRLAGPTGAASTTYVYSDTTNGSSVAQAPAWTNSPALSGANFLANSIPIASVGSAGLSGSAPISIASTGAISCSTCLTSSGVSGMTAGQVPIAATATTITSSEALAGAGAGITTGPVSGTTANDIVTQNGTNGQVKDSGVLITAIPAADIASGALANGMTATTQTAASNDTKLATDAYVDGHFIASGTSAMGTGGISSGTCATTVTTAASGVATTDVIVYTSNVNPQGVTGYAASATGSLYIWAYPTSGNVNFEVCNNTASTITPSALTLNWKVTR